MGHQEKQSIVSIIGSVLVVGFYSMYVYNNYVAGNPEILNDFKFWGKSFLYLIPVGIVVNIVIHIVFAIANRIVTREDIPDFTDERDKLIELKSIRISHWIFILGFMFAMGSLAFDMNVPDADFVRVSGQHSRRGSQNYLLPERSVTWKPTTH